MTKFHVKTAAEVCHKLEGTAYFNELDMGYSFHQVPLSTITSSKLPIFQSHEGLNRMKRLFFGPKALLGIFHNIVMQCFRGAEGVTTILNNILVYGATPAEHHINLKNCLREASGFDWTSPPSSRTRSTGSAESSQPQECLPAPTRTKLSVKQGGPTQRRR